jgi:hypothetical protein
MQVLELSLALHSQWRWNSFRYNPDGSVLAFLILVERENSNFHVVDQSPQSLPCDCLQNLISESHSIDSPPHSRLVDSCSHFLK